MVEYKIHFTDKYGDCTIDCTFEDYDNRMNWLKQDSEVDNIWVEHYDEETGWQA